ncbi:MAG TPA: CopG family transcriptional regulator [Gemmatimonadota bacterium]|nr:CopG family transcriptional regulator [Gemmatimonadota bacterium]
MRTTLTLDDDIAARLRAEARSSGRSFREVVNDAIRQGLAGRRVAEAAAPFRVTPRDLGNLRPGLSLDNIGELLERIEDPLHR